ncbi:hypothetical protein ATY41_06885 [Leifsonia xyli subsp. xyli]|uniref:Uncharacterized protein n=1 Tax=Leifsonia xyli subsp. xyli TaxID=59736 RepID=A0A1E2SMU0_LEIXY|nr:hypothetical protein ATY41_06885 [Leifsonia xyli subsp. xyli]
MFIGVVLMLVIVGVVAIGLNLFALPAFVNIAFIVTLSMVAAGYGVVGIHRIERGRRNENDVAF